MLLPTLTHKKYGYVNLNLHAIAWVKTHPSSEENPLLNPETCQQFVNDVHTKLGIDYSYGGWLEDRSVLWRGSYLEKTKQFLHLGIDVNVPAQTPIAAAIDATIIRIDDDHPTQGGWGPRIILQATPISKVFIYAHLDRNITCKVGDHVAANQIIARAGKAPLNGDWFSHIHIQVMDTNYFHSLTPQQLQSLDGYGSTEQISALASLFPDPLAFISL